MNDKSPKHPRRDRTVNFTFRSQPRLKTKHGTVLHFLNSDEESVLPRQQRILLALTAFWLPLAARQRGDFPQEQLQQLARDSIYQLELHIRYLEESFGLDRKPVVSSSLSSDEARQSLNSVFDANEEEDSFANEDDILSNWK